MKTITKKEPKSALIEVGEKVIQIEAQIKFAQEEVKRQRAFILQGMQKNRLKSLKMDDGTVFVIKEGNRTVVIKNHEKAEKYIDEMNCWKIDNTKLLKIFGNKLKVPPFFGINRGDKTLMIKKAGINETKSAS